MTKNNIEVDLKILLENCDEILQDLENKKTGLIGWRPNNIPVPEIDLTLQEISDINKKLEVSGQIIGKIRKFAPKINPDFSNLSQKIVDSHAQAYNYTLNMENGSVFPSDYGILVAFTATLKEQIQNFENKYKIFKTYNKISENYGDESHSFGGIHWGKTSIVIAVILAIVTLSGSVIIADYYHNLSKEEIIPSNNDPNQEPDEFERINSLEHQRVIKTFEEGRPFSIVWTGCSMSIESDQSENITEYVFSLTPIILDKNNQTVTIPFHTSYKLDFEGLIPGNSFYSYIEHNQISKHLVNYEGGTPIILNLKNTFDEAEKIGATSMYIIMNEASLTPYSTIIDKNLQRYDDVLEDKHVTSFVHVPVLNEWKESDSNKESLCNNLYKN